MSIRLGADKANIALQQVLTDVADVKCDVGEVRCDVAEVKSDVAARVTEVKNEVVEVKSDVQDVKCMRFSSRNRLRWRLNLPLRGTDRGKNSQMVLAARPVHKLQHCMQGPI